MDPYRVLGLPQSATAEEIKRRYQLLAKQLHPDKGAAESTEASPPAPAAGAVCPCPIPPVYSGCICHLCHVLLPCPRRRPGSLPRVAGYPAAAGLAPSASDFLELQTAWEALRTDASRATVDVAIKGAAAKMHTAVQVAVDVDLDDMEFAPEERDEQGGVYSYRCRCGDHFVVTECARTRVPLPADTHPCLAAHAWVLNPYTLTAAGGSLKGISPAGRRQRVAARP